MIAIHLLHPQRTQGTAKTGWGQEVQWGWSWDPKVRERQARSQRSEEPQRSLFQTRDPHREPTAGDPRDKAAGGGSAVLGLVVNVAP